MSFEAEYRKLEEILAKLEGGELSLEESLQQYEQGVSALRSCREILTKAELRIQELTPPAEERPS